MICSFSKEYDNQFFPQTKICWCYSSRIRPKCETAEEHLDSFLSSSCVTHVLKDFYENDSDKMLQRSFVSSPLAVSHRALWSQWSIVDLSAATALGWLTVWFRRIVVETFGLYPSVVKVTHFHVSPLMVSVHNWRQSIGHALVFILA